MSNDKHSESSSPQPVSPRGQDAAPAPVKKSATEVVDALLADAATKAELEKKSDIEIGQLVRDHVWAKCDMFSAHSALLEEVCDRLIQRNCEHKVLKAYETQGMSQCEYCGKIFERGENPAPAPGVTEATMSEKHYCVDSARYFHLSELVKSGDFEGAKEYAGGAIEEKKP